MEDNIWVKKRKEIIDESIGKQIIVYIKLRIFQGELQCQK